MIVYFADHILTMDDSDKSNPLGEIRDGAVAVEDGVVVYLGSQEQCPHPATVFVSDEFLMPALVDMHTHSIWAGDRADEWRRRLAGEDYTEILKKGGGILSTVATTRAASDELLLRCTTERLKVMKNSGVGTVEIKTGYALELVNELRCLKLMKAAGELADLEVVRTFLGAHTVPAEYRSRPQAYVDLVVSSMLPEVAEHADFCDVYCDEGAFTLHQSERILTQARDLGLKLKIHAEQITHTGSAAMAAELGAYSADHLEEIDDDGVLSMAEFGVVAGLLPGAQLYLNGPCPPTQKMREAGVKMAVATDLNPGTSPMISLWTAATLAVLKSGLTVEEALLGITANAADALGHPTAGRIKAGQPVKLICAKPALGASLTPAGLIQALNGPTVRWPTTSDLPHNTPVAPES